jgi:hypothetical protein
MNNFSHAADLLCYIFGESTFEKLHITQHVFDEFDDDPTISFTTSYNEIPVSVVGLANARYSYFEMEIFFRDKKISILDGGNKISYCTAPAYDKFYQPLVKDVAENKENLLSDHMKYVYQNVHEVYEDKQPDNFMSSLKMNQNILQIIRQ